MRAIAFQALGTGFAAAVSFALVVFLGRRLGPGVFGDYVAVLSIAVVALVLIEGGWAARLYRQQVDAGDDARALAADGGRALAQVLLVGTLLAALAAVSAHGRFAPAWLAFACMVPLALANQVSARLRGAGHFGQEAIWQAGGRLLSATAIVGALQLYAASAATVFAAWTVAGVLLLPFAWRWLSRPRLDGLGAGARAGASFVAIEGALVLLLRGDMIAIGSLPLPAAELSAYAVCTRFSEACVLLFAPVTNVMLRRLRLDVAQPAHFTRSLARALAAATTLGLLAWLVGSAAATPLVVRLFGAPFAPAAALLPWVLVALPLLLPNLVLMQAAIARGHERAAALRLATVAALLLAAVALAATTAGLRTAAVAFVVVQAVLFAALIPLARRAPR